MGTNIHIRVETNGDLRCKYDYMEKNFAYVPLRIRDTESRMEDLLSKLLNES